MDKTLLLDLFERITSDRDIVIVEMVPSGSSEHENQCLIIKNKKLTRFAIGYSGQNLAEDSLLRATQRTIDQTNNKTAFWEIHKSEEDDIYTFSIWC